MAAVWWGFNRYGGLVYSRLVKNEPGYLKRADGTFSGDLAESWEMSPDLMTMTMRLRNNAAWHPIEPVNGRLLEASDVVASWERFVANGTQRSNFANSVSSDAPIVSMTAIDTHTLRIDLAYPTVLLPAVLAIPGAFNILPREADEEYDPRHQAIGTGHYYVSEYTPSVRVVLERNPGYYDQHGAYFDSIELPIITEYAAGLGQFRAGALYDYPVHPNDIIDLKKDVSALNLYQSDLTRVGPMVIFGYRPTEGGVFRDVRLRQAYSMSIDRHLFIETIGNTAAFEVEGLEMESLIGTVMPPDFFEGWWLDPEGEDFGPNAKYFKRDLDEAKKLLSAAGYPDGLEVISNHINTNEYGTTYVDEIEILEGMAAEAGFSFKKNIVNYQTEFIPNFRNSRGDFEGIAYHRGLTSLDATELMSRFLTTAGGNSFVGMDPDGLGTFAGDPYVEEQVLKAREELDTEARRAIVFDLQRYLANKMYFIRQIGATTSFTIAWPVLQNYEVFKSPQRYYFHEWLDPSKAPLA